MQTSMLNQYLSRYERDAKWKSVISPEADHKAFHWMNLGRAESD